MFYMPLYRGSLMMEYLSEVLYAVGQRFFNDRVPV